MLLQLWGRELGAFKWTGSISWPDSKGFGLAHYLTFISSLLQIFSSQKEARRMKPDYSVVLSLMVPPAPKWMVRKELIIRLVYWRAQDAAAMQNQRIIGEHCTLTQRSALSLPTHLHFFNLPHFLRDQILQFVRLKGKITHNSSFF